jgi:pyruvate formate lyase activating enzyme
MPDDERPFGAYLDRVGQREPIGPDTVRGTHHHALEDGRVQCDVCPRHCRLHDGQRGFCFIREARGPDVVLTSYGRASGFCIDPIEKKPLNHFYPGTSVLSFGTAGCNLGCKFCQNWDISKAREREKLNGTAQPEDIARAAREACCKSIAFTYNDPVIWLEYATDCAHAARELGIKTVAVTAGYITPQARPEFFAAMDATNVDLKAFTDTFYEKTCFAKLGPVLETLEWIKHESQTWLEVTTLLIPGMNDSDAEISALSEWMVEHLGPYTPLHFTAFHPDFKLTHVEPTPASTLLRARERARSAGMQHVYTGNVYDPESQSTQCTNCQRVVIERDGYTLKNFALDERGDCAHCGHALVGHFDEAPGNWGARRRRLPLSLGASS